MRVACAILGSGNIGTDLMSKILRRSQTLELVALVGADPHSDGLARGAELGVTTSHEGIDGLMRLDRFRDIRVVFDATSAGAHARHDALLRQHGKQIIDLTPAALGPYVVPTVNLDAHLHEPNINMVTCGGQATIPIVAAISRVTRVHYAEIVASIASRSAGPGTRANIDEFTQTTARGLRIVGGAEQAKAIIVLNPAEPPLVMRDTVFCRCDPVEETLIRESIAGMIRAVQAYVPGFQLKQPVQFQQYEATGPRGSSQPQVPCVGLQVSTFLEITGAADYLPAYAGNLDIMTSAALCTAERLGELRGWTH